MLQNDQFNSKPYPSKNENRTCYHDFTVVKAGPQAPLEFMLITSERSWGIRDGLKNHHDLIKLGHDLKDQT